MTDTNTLAPTDDLQKRCAEIIGWYRTGVLVGDTLRSHAESKWPGDIHNLQMAERATENEALCFIAKWGGSAPASQPFAYEFSRSNGDGTHSEHIERGRLQEVAPGRWEHSGLPRGALADKPIKALYTTPQTQPAAVPASGPVGFDHKTAANFLNGKAVTDEEVLRFVAHSRWAHDDRDGLRNTIADLRREIAQRDAEIALLKASLLDAEALELRSAPAGVEPVARIRYERNTPGRENEMPRVLSCNRMADGVYEVFTAAQVQAMLSVGLAPGWQAVPMEPTKEMKVAAVKFANGPAVYKAVAATALEIEEGIYGEAYEAMLASAPSGPAREPLTDEQIEALPVWSHFVGLWPESRKEIARAIEAAHGIAAQEGDAA